ncbi:hypothetical protein J5690_10415 [bacterium]|nr:hypothetical protein [bacterium]
MKKSCFFVFLAFLFAVSCSGSKDAPVPCITVGDCPDSSYSCLDGWCVSVNAADDGLSGGNSSDDTLPDGGQNGGGNSSEDGGENNGNGDGKEGNDKENEEPDSELPDPVKPDDDEKPESSSDNDTAENSDKDNAENSDKDDESSDKDGGETSDSDGEENDGETADGNGGEENTDKENGDDTDGGSDTDSENGGDGDSENGGGDSENGGDADNDSDADADSGNGGETPEDTVSGCSEDSDCALNPGKKYCNTAEGKCVICLSDEHCDPALGQNCNLATNECVSNATCAAAVAQLPNGGVYNWDDGTTQYFSTNTYWGLVESSVIPARSGSHSFGKYSGYTQNSDYTSVLEQVRDLSSCSQCALKAHFYVKGKNYSYTCTNTNQTFIHPTCNGEGVTTAANKTGVTWSQWTIPPEAPWEDARLDSGKDFLSVATACRYSAAAWTDLEWTIPETCKTDQFVFAFRFRSDSSVTGPGLVVDDLTIAPAATAYVPNGEFESATAGYIKGWACDLDFITKNVLIKVEYYKNKDESAVAAERWVYANREITPSEESPLAVQCSATYNHGFGVPFDSGLKAVLGIGTHSAAVFAVDVPSAETLCGGTYTKLGETKEFEITEAVDPKK